MFLLLLSNVFVAATFTIAKLALLYMTPYYLVAIRAIASGLLLIIVHYILHPSTFILRREYISSLLQAGFFNIFLSYCLEFWAFQYVSSIKVTLIYNLAMFISPIYAYFFFQEKMNKIKLIGLLIGIAGVLPIILTTTPHERSLAALGMLSWPEIALISAVIVYCYGWVHVKKLTLQGCPILLINGISALFGGSCASVAAIFFEQWRPISHPESFLLWLSLLMLTGNFLGAYLYALSFKRYSLSLVAFGSLTIPLFTSMYGYLLLGEILTWNMIISLAIVFCGLYIFYQEEIKEI